MNLIDFSVVEIIEEKYGPIYELCEMTKEEAVEDGSDYLFHYGCYQACKTRDMGGEQIDYFIHDITNGVFPYKVGSKGFH